MSLSPEETQARLESRAGCVGIDVSKWQDPEEMWSSPPPSILNFCIIKFSQHTFKDAKRIAHHEGAGRFDLLRGAYHFLDPRSSGLDQAATLLAATEGLPFELPLVCDLEGTSNWPTHDHAGHAAADMLEALHAERGELPWLYTSKRHLDRLSEGVLDRLRPYPCWIASYWKNIPPASHVPSVPAGFKVVVHQWCSDNQIADLRGWFDHSLDTNFSMLPIHQLATEGGGSSPRYVIDEPKAESYNEREIKCLEKREKIDQVVGADPWDSWSERLQRIAAWQDEKGLTPDGMVGPATRSAMKL